MFQKEYLSFNRVGVLPIRSYYVPFDKGDSITFKNGIIDREKSSRFISLDGEWKIKKYPSIDSLTDISAKLNQTINVPSCVQIHGLDGLQYINTLYPIPFNPPHVPHENPVFHYRKTVNLNPKGDERYYLNFEGVDSAFYLFINSEKLGYSQISHETSEFDITNYLKKGKNQIDVVVLKWCASTYLEDQDKLRYTGIFRSVYILRRPSKHLTDFVINTKIDENNGIISVKNESEIAVECSVLNKKRVINAGESGEFVIKNAKFWTAETPHLYNLTLVANGEKILQRVGIRTVCVDNGVFKINGKHVKLKGVNRHESNCRTGATVTVLDTLNDIKLMKKLNVNAIRTSHYPNMPQFYELCDKMGIYVMDEADLETHGVVTSEGEYARELWQEYATKDLFEPGIFEREQALVERDKNFTSVVIWSLGNESSYGKAFHRGADYVRARDSRPIHFECLWEMADKSDYYTDRVQMVGRMYPEPEWLLNGYLTDEKETRPLVLCEYTHSMGNSNGDLSDYWKIINSNDRFMGAFVWEWCDHAIMGKKGLLYGGDFGERDHDGNFCVDGMVTADRKLKSNSFEIQAVYGGKVTPDEPVSKCEPLANLPNDNPLKVTIDEHNASVTQIEWQGKKLLKQPIKLNVYRAFIDNDRNMNKWFKLPEATPQVTEIVREKNKVTLRGVMARTCYAPVMSFEFTISAFNRAIDLHLSYESADYIGYLPRVGVTFAIDKKYSDFTFFGYGKGESYVDKRLASTIGEHHMRVKENMANNLMPQECGSHYYTSYVQTGNLKITAEKPFSFSILPYSTEHLLKCKHSWELGKQEYTHVCLDIGMSGIGSNSCGPMLNERYHLPKKGSNKFRINVLGE